MKLVMRLLVVVVFVAGLFATCGCGGKELEKAMSDLQRCHENVTGLEDEVKESNDRSRALEAALETLDMARRPCASDELTDPDKAKCLNFAIDDAVGVLKVRRAAIAPYGVLSLSSKGPKL